MAQYEHMAVEDFHRVTGAIEQHFRCPVFERQMRFAAAEINTVVKRPLRRRKRNSHDASFRTSLAAGSANASLTQSRSFFRPEITSTWGCHPSAWVICEV